MQDRPEIHVRLPAELLEHLRGEARYRGLSVAAYARLLFLADMNRQAPARRRPIPQP